ncbi:MAG: TfoX/Sxy family protein [Gemmatimonadota bacterium]
MPVSPGFRDFILEQLRRLVPGAAARAMFGGVSIAGPEGTFALLADDVVYLKGDAQNRERFLAEGWPAFKPFGAEGSSMGYYAVPGELLEDVEVLAPWVLLAREAAQRAPAKKKKRS